MEIKDEALEQVNGGNDGSDHKLHISDKEFIILATSSESLRNDGKIWVPKKLEDEKKL